MPDRSLQRLGPNISISRWLVSFGKRRLKSQRQKLVDLTLDLIEDDFQQRMQKVYRYQGTTLNRWKPNALRYQKFGKPKGGERSRYFGRPPGVRTGRTKRQLTQGENLRVKDSIHLGFVPAYMVPNLYGKINSRRLPVRDPYLAVQHPDGQIRAEVFLKWANIIRNHTIYFTLNPRRKIRRR